MNIREIFAMNVKRNRIKKKMSQEELGFQSGLHRTYISDIERQTRSISLDNIQKIADALDIPVYQLFIVEDEFND